MRAGRGVKLDVRLDKMCASMTRMIDGDDCQPVVIDSDFIGLRAALVREFGAMEAIVRLIYFCTSTVMSLSWWRATGEISPNPQGCRLIRSNGSSSSSRRPDTPSLRNIAMDASQT